MRIALGVIALALLGAAAAGAFVLRGGEYVMFLLALGLVTFFGSLPVVLGVLTRPRGAIAEDDDVVVISRSGDAPSVDQDLKGATGADAGAARCTRRTGAWIDP